MLINEPEFTNLPFIRKIIGVYSENLPQATIKMIETQISEFLKEYKSDLPRYFIKTGIKPRNGEI